MKIIKKIINVLTTLIIVVGGIFLVLYLFGIVPYVILSGSMEPTLPVGSLVIVTPCEYEDLVLNDIVTMLEIN